MTRMKSIANLFFSLYNFKRLYGSCAHIFRNEYDTIWTISSIINIQKIKNICVEFKLILTIAIKELLASFKCDSRVIFFFFSVKYH